MFRTLFGATFALLCAAIAVGCQSNGGDPRPPIASSDTLNGGASASSKAASEPVADFPDRAQRRVIDRNGPPYTKYPHLGRNHFYRPVSKDAGDR